MFNDFFSMIMMQHKVVAFATVKKSHLIKLKIITLNKEKKETKRIWISNLFKKTFVSSPFKKNQEKKQQI